VRQGELLELKPLYALGVVPNRPWYRYHSSKEDQQLSRRLAQEMKLPGGTFILVLNSANRKMKRIMQRIPGSEIYRR
jgi:hypothetical protein